jgi:hypothetical protein
MWDGVTRGRGTDEDRDNVPQEDFSADFEVNPISEIGVCGSYALGLEDGVQGQRKKTGRKH